MQWEVNEWFEWERIMFRVMSKIVLAVVQLTGWRGTGAKVGPQREDCRWWQ